MTYPSIKRIARLLNVDTNTACTIRELMDGRCDPEIFDDVIKWRYQCYNWPPSRPEMVMCAINGILQAHGVESIATSTYVDRYHDHIRYTYCNMGDPYKYTVVYDALKGKYMVCSWGDLPGLDNE